MILHLVGPGRLPGLHHGSGAALIQHNVAAAGKNWPQLHAAPARAGGRGGEFAVPSSRPTRTTGAPSAPGSGCGLQNFYRLGGRRSGRLVMRLVDGKWQTIVAPRPAAGEDRARRGQRDRDRHRWHDAVLRQRLACHRHSWPPAADRLRRTRRLRRERPHGHDLDIPAGARLFCVSRRSRSASSQSG